MTDVTPEAEPAPAPADTGSLISVGSAAEKEPVSETPTEAPAEAEQDEAPASDDSYMYAGKYKSIEELEKGYKEVVQKLTEKTPSAPEEYEFNFSENEALKHVNIDLENDPTYAKMVPLFKELNLTQDQASAIFNTYLESEFGDMPDPGNEMMKLGPKANDIIKRVSGFVERNFNEVEQGIAQQIGATAEGVQFLDKIAMMRGEQPIPTNAQDFAPRKTHQQLLAEAVALRQSAPNFDIDKQAQAKYEALMDEAVKRQLGSK